MARSSKPGTGAALSVVRSDGARHRFLRGIITHSLTQRGVSFDLAYAIARAIRSELANRDEVSTSELSERVEHHLEKHFEDEPVPGKALARPLLLVSYGGDAQPFSRGLLAQNLTATGLEQDRAYQVVLELQEQLSAEGVTRIRSGELARRVAETLERAGEIEPARRYRLLRHLRRLPKPLVLYIGGASGVGKSTLSVDLANKLSIYRINSTDTIRQVMRMVFTDAMLPSLHRSSFESDRDDTSSDRWQVQLFEEQATQVCVGVRAVVERAITENLNILVEGVHLLPPLIPFRDLDGAAYQVSLLLSTLDEETHRSHLLSRANVRGRPAERYLSHFTSIRLQQELLLDRAEEHDVALIDTTDPDQTAFQAVGVLVHTLQKRVPWLASERDASSESLIPSLLLVIDGLPDHPLRSLGGRTPLEGAETPTLDRLATEGLCGLADPVAPGVVPDTAAGTLALLGQPPAAMKRGPIEAIGAGIALGPDDIALRANFATLDETGIIVDRRAGRIRGDSKQLAKFLEHQDLLEDEDIEVSIRNTTEHRLAIVLRGEGLSSEIVGSDPGEAAQPGAPLTPSAASSDPAATRTAELLAKLEQRARRLLTDHEINREREAQGLLPANCLLTRGAGRAHKLAELAPHGVAPRLACVSGDRTVLGISTLLSASTFTHKRMTANLDTDLALKFHRAAQALEDHDLVLLHVKGADIAAHDQRADLKVRFVEAVDSALHSFLESWRGPLRVAVASDHSTITESGLHGSDPVPVLLWGTGIEADQASSFSERSVHKGQLGRFSLQHLVDRLFEPQPQPLPAGG